jgi:NhaP-type Na+/H+ or K+/H+ antiporter
MPALPLAADPGFHFGDVFAIGVLFLGLAVVAAVSALSHQHERAFSASLIYLGLGAVAAVAIGVLDIAWIGPIGDSTVLEHIAEAGVVAALFSTGLKIDRALNWREWGSVGRLILLAMPLTIAGVALFASTVMGLSLAAALLLGAALAPTDPVLAGDVGVGPPGDEDEHEPNFALTAEAALNDGLAAPFVLLGVLLVEEAGTGWLGEWLLADVAWAVIVGFAVGAAVGLFAAWSVKRLRDRDLLAPALDGWHAISTALITYGVAEAVDGYGFLAVFAAGLAFRRYERDHEVNGRVHHGAEILEKFLELAVILMLGSLLTLDGLGAPGWTGWLLAPVLIVVIRPLACVVALARGRVETRTERGFVAWFGVRGVGSLYYAAVIAGAGVLSAGELEVVVWTVIACVLVSITVHGLSGGPALRRLSAFQRGEDPEPVLPGPVRRRRARAPETTPAR